ncbi:MAG: universal stress protein [Nitrospirae bacterium]|nr:MAG: universal stress protein [Nitrospirota bacterium]
MRALLAVDGSESSYEAVRAVQHFAPLDQLIMVMVIEVPATHHRTRWPSLDHLVFMIEQDAREDAQRVLDRAAALLPQDAGPIIRRIEKGKPAERILDIAVAESVDVIIVGARGLSRIRELVFGSVSHRIMTHAPCSTLVVKAPCSRLEQVLLCIEGPEDGRRAVAWLAQKPFRVQPRITILHVVPFAEPPWLEGALVPESYRKELLAAGDQLVNQVAFDLRAFDYHATLHVMVGSPTDMIVRYAEQAPPDLTIVGSHGRRGFSRFLMGSVSHDVAHRVPGAVMIVREPNTH